MRNDSYCILTFFWQLKLTNIKEDMNLTPRRLAMLRLKYGTGVSKIKRNFCTAPSLTGFDDYDETKKSFHLTSPEYFNFATDVIDKWASKEARLVSFL